MIQDMVNEAVDTERERCAKLVEEECIYLVGRLQAKAIADKIRKSAYPTVLPVTNNEA